MAQTMTSPASDLRTRPMQAAERRGFDFALDSLALWARQIETQAERNRIGDLAQRMRAARHLACALKQGTGGPTADTRPA